MSERIFDIIVNLKKKCLDREESIQREYNLSPAEYNGILSVKPDEIYSCNELSKKLGLSVSRSSRVLEKLIKNGYFKGIKNKYDKRSLKVSLTEKGVSTREKINQKLDECEKDIIGKLKKSDIYSLENTLNKLTDVFN